MDEGTLTYIVAPIISAAIGGAAWLVKHYFEKKDEEQDRMIEGRNIERARIEKRIDDLTVEVKQTRNEVNELVGMIAGCENPNCPNRPRLREKLTKGGGYGNNSEQIVA